MKVFPCNFFKIFEIKNLQELKADNKELEREKEDLSDKLEEAQQVQISLIFESKFFRDTQRPIRKLTRKMTKFDGFFQWFFVFFFDPQSEEKKLASFPFSLKSFCRCIPHWTRRRFLLQRSTAHTIDKNFLKTPFRV